MSTVLCVPQWQGSASERAPLLASGAHRTAELLRADIVVDNVVGAAITEHAPSGDNPGEADIIRHLGAALRR